MNSSWTLKKYQDQQLMYQERIEYFKKNKNLMYKAAVQQYKDWITGINYSNIDKSYVLNLQKEYRKYFGIRKSNNLKRILKNFLGLLDIRLVSKLKSVSKYIRKSEIK